MGVYGFHSQWSFTMEFDLGGEVGLGGWFITGVEGRSWLGGVYFGVFYGCSAYIRHLCLVVSELPVSVHLVQELCNIPNHLELKIVIK